MASSVNPSTPRVRRWRARRRLERAHEWREAHPRLVRMHVALDAWFARGLLLPPTASQLPLMHLLQAHPGAVDAAVRAMPVIPQYGRTYRLVGAMVAAARAFLHSITPTRNTPPGGVENPTPLERNARAVIVIGDGTEAERSGADGPVESIGARPEPKPTGIAAFRALREPGGALYQGAPPADPSSSDRVALRRARVRQLRRPAYRQVS